MAFSMIFQFLHFGHPCTAFVIYEPFQVQDTMIVYILDFKNELGGEAIFFAHDEKRWTTYSPIKECCSTYQSLCEKLNEIFIDHKFSFEPSVAA
jgi:hypothetical protein